MGQIWLYMSLIWGVIVGNSCIVNRFDAPTGCLTKKELINLIVYSQINAVIIFIINQAQFGIWSGMMISAVAGCLLFACLTDYRYCEVYEFIWWIAGALGVILLFQQCYAEFKSAADIGLQIQQKLLPLFIYIVLQEIFFCKFYGRADCHAFVICALIECTFKMGMLGYLLHMIFAFLCLAVVQTGCRNISKTGNLKRPVAFLPYITFSFWVLLFFEKSVILKRISEINL